MIARGLQILGAISLLALLGLAIWFGYAELRNVDRHNEASARDATFILQQAGLDASQRIEVVSSAESARSLTGDHLDHYCLQLSDIRIAQAEQAHWKVPVDFEKPLHGALGEAFQQGNGAACLSVPSLEAISDIRANVLAASFRSGQLSAFRVLLLDPQKQRLLYVSYRS
jgi:hypothetical protein